MRTFVASMLVSFLALACVPASASEPTFAKLVDQFWDEELAHNPASATALGVHTFDDKLIDLSAAAIGRYLAAQKAWSAKLAAVDAKKLSPAEVIDLAVVKAQVRASIVDIEEVRRWHRLPRMYAEPAINSVYLVVKRDFAPLAERLKSVIARERQVPQLVAAAKANLDDVDPINVELALEELPSNVDFLEKDAVAAFAKVADASLQKQLKGSTLVATRALKDYGTWLKVVLLPKAKGHFALGADAFAHKLAAEEGITEPLAPLLARGQAELERLRVQFIATAKKIDATKSATDVQASLAADHGKPETLVADVQSRLAGLRKFLVDKQIVTIPSEVMPIVQESPPFMRAFTMASMDTPGPYETKATEAYYNVTLPDPKCWEADRHREGLGTRPGSTRPRRRRPGAGGADRSRRRCGR